ncbi:MAG TPA: Tat pathway signal protein [Caulobacteraceae bacterium]|jgi:hypothetical protein|nr:Tat pathway signal protein [Caulobacteraceae bacterium]
MIGRRLLITFLAALAFAPAGAHAADAKKKGGGLDYIQLPALTATIIRGDGRRGVMTVETGVDVPGNAALRTRAEISQPRLRAAYLIVLQAYASGLGAGYPPDADYISRTLQRETDKVLGGPGAKLLLGAILVN